MATAHLRPLRPLGIAYLFCFPLTCFSLWITWPLALSLLWALLTGPWADAAKFLFFPDGQWTTFNGLAIGFSLWPPLGLLPVCLVLWIALGLVRSRERVAQVTKYVALVAIPSSLLGLNWSLRDLERVDWSMGVSREGFVKETIVVVALPLLWHLFVLWYLRGYPWRRQKAAASSQLPPTPE